MATDRSRLHGRIPGDRPCAAPGCAAAGEFRAPLRAATFDGPGQYRWLCLDHVREFNSGYNFFAGMSAEEITAAQSPISGWERQTRAFAGVGADPAPSWANFRDPLEAIQARFGKGAHQPAAASRFTGEEQRALEALGLPHDTDRRALRQRYSDLVRRYHPDRNGGDRRHEAKLQRVVEAYQTLKGSAAFS